MCLYIYTNDWKQEQTEIGKRGKRETKGEEWINGRSENESLEKGAVPIICHVLSHTHEEVRFFTARHDRFVLQF